ncbi:MAG: sigma-70 family RNA polymerase sigma factor [bacterium]
MSRQDLEALFLSTLPATDRILGALARRHGLSADAAEEFAAWSRMRLVENDYAVLGKFRGESSISTYLTVVLAMLFREYRVAQWGRWRPSAAARRNGPLAIRLETLTQRDGLPVAHAGQVLRTSGETALSDRELADIVATFPKRLRPKAVDPGTDLLEPVSPTRADETIDAEESGAEANAAQHALQQALDMLPTEERLIVRMHYMEEMSVADIARGLAIPQKPLYRRLDRVLGTLRNRLESAGISRDLVRELATGPP